jgi:hypothetical protein
MLPDPVDPDDFDPADVQPDPAFVVHDQNIVCPVHDGAGNHGRPIAAIDVDDVAGHELIKLYCLHGLPFERAPFPDVPCPGLGGKTQLRTPIEKRPKIETHTLSTSSKKRKDLTACSSLDTVTQRCLIQTLFGGGSRY